MLMAFATITGPCGDTMEIWIKVSEGAISKANFMTDGCGTSIASGHIWSLCWQPGKPLWHPSRSAGNLFWRP